MVGVDLPDSTTLADVDAGVYSDTPLGFKQARGY